MVHTSETSFAKIKEKRLSIRNVRNIDCVHPQQRGALRVASSTISVLLVQLQQCYLKRSILVYEKSQKAV